MKMLLEYIDAWRRHDVHGVLDTLAVDCVIIECYGPIYRGRDRVEQWMRAWFGPEAPSTPGMSPGMAPALTFW